MDHLHLEGRLLHITVDLVADGYEPGRHLHCADGSGPEAPRNPLGSVALCLLELCCNP